MPYIYSNPQDESDPHKLPDVQVLQFSADELALADEDTVYEFMKRPEFRAANMNRATMDRMIDAIVEENGIKGGWCFQFCFPGCLPESSPFGPYETYQEAVEAAQSFNDQ